MIVKIYRYIAMQFRKPTGLLGRIACICMNISNRKMYDAVAADIKSEKSILDIGYGNGYLIEKLYAKTGAKIKGIDISEDMRSAAAKRNKKGVDSGDIELLVGDCCDMPFDDDTFDAVTTSNTIYFWSDTLKGLQEIRRVLRKGGKFRNVLYAKKYFEHNPMVGEIYKSFSKKELVELGRKAGFSSVRITDIVKGLNFMVTYTK